MKPTVLLLLALACLASHIQAADIIPAERRITWDPGIPGGIPDRTTVHATLDAIDATGGSDVRAAIQAALNACPADQVVQLPAGRFRINGGLSMPNRVILRGAGPTTVLESRGSAAGLIVFGSGGVPWDPTAISTGITAGATRDSTSLTVASASGLAVGTLLVITELNDPSFVTIDATCNSAATWVDNWNTNGTRARGQIVQVTSISGTTIGITPGLYSAYTRTPWATHFAAQCQWSGVENLKTSANNTGTERNFLFQSAAYCWVKNVESDYTDGDHMTLDWSYRCEIRHNHLHDSYIHTSGSFDNMIGLRSKSSACLVIDNIIRRLHVSVMCEWGAAGNVIAYNYTEGEFDEAAASGNRWLPGGLNLNHGAHPQFNLFEGNITGKIAADAYWGSSSDTTLFRNDIVGTGVASPPFTGRGVENTSQAVALIQGNRAVDIWEVQSRYNIVGNVVGVPALAARGVVRRVVSPASRAYDNPPYCFSYGYTTEADGGSTAMQNPLTSVIEHGNWDVASSAITWDPAIASHDVPASLFLAAKPAWFGDLAWPPIDPANTSTRSIERIPAGYRYVHGYDPLSVADTTPPSVPAGLTATAASATQINLSWTAATDNVGVAGYRIFRGGTQIGTSTGTTYSSTGLSPSTAYTYTVEAYDSASNVSAVSSAASATTQANHAPVASNQSVSFPAGSTSNTITLTAADADGDSLTYQIITQPASGSLSSVSGAQVTFTAPATPGTSTFTFKATDSCGAVSTLAATVTITVTAGVTKIGNSGEGSIMDSIGDTVPWINASRFTAANAMTVAVIKAKVGAITGSYQCAVYADAASAPGALLRATTQVTNPAAGWQTFTLTSPLALTSGTSYWLAIWSSAANATVYAETTGGTMRWGQYAYGATWPNPIATTGGGGYLYSIYAETGASANQAPVAAAQVVTATEDTAEAITLVATDANGNALTYTIVATPMHGVLTGTGTARTYTPAANYAGADSFTFKANDGTVDSNTATVSITVTAVNDVPVATGQSVATAQDTAKAITLAGTDVEGGTLTFATSAPAHGTLSGSGASRTYTPTTGYSGADGFTFTVYDGTATSPAATVSITVMAVANTAPVVSAASALTSPVTGVTTVLSATATDNAGEAALTYAWIATGPAPVTFSATNTNAAKGATATFIKAGSYVLTVTAKDAGNLTATRTVAVTVNATPTRATLSPTSASVQPLKTVDFNAMVEDQFGSPVTAQPTMAWTVSGGGTIDANGLFTAGAGAINPSGGITATTYTVTATGGGWSATALVTVSLASTATATGGGCGSGAAAGLILCLGMMLALRRRC